MASVFSVTFRGFSMQNGVERYESGVSHSLVLHGIRQCLSCVIIQCLSCCFVIRLINLFPFLLSCSS